MGPQIGLAQDHDPLRVGAGEGHPRRTVRPDAASGPKKTCPNGEDRRGVIYDINAEAEGELTPSAAVDVFLRREGDDANLDDFELIEENETKATYAYSDGEFELVRLSVRKLPFGWFVDSYEFCQGSI